MSTAGTLTVKHIEEGREGIVQAIRVEWRPGGDDVTASVIAYGVPAAVTLSTWERYETGLVYVMNEAGATVARYDIEAANLKPERRQAA